MIKTTGLSAEHSLPLVLQKLVMHQPSKLLIGLVAFQYMYV
jgi:hypothetical protein